MMTKSYPPPARIQRLLSQRRKPATVVDASAAEFRPTERPPHLAVCIVDGAENGGEWHRVRDDRATIGRTDCDLSVPHDAGIADRHAELVRVAKGRGFRWWLRDLETVGGTFVRVTAAVLQHEQEFLIGKRRFRFEAATGRLPAAETAPWAQQSDSDDVQVITPASVPRLAPLLVEITSAGRGARTPLTSPENWIGSDPTCQHVVRGDRFVSGRHAKIVRRNGRWYIEDTGSRNGIWVRIREVLIDSTAEFQAGEQRFVAKVC